MILDWALVQIVLGPAGGLAGNHGLAGLVTLVVGLAAGAAGTVLKGRWRPKWRYNRMQAHYLLTGILSGLIVLMVVVGLYLMAARDLPFLRSLHGLNGMLLLIVTGVSLVTSPCITRRYFGKLRHHSFSVYLAGILLVVQVVLGLMRLAALTG